MALSTKSIAASIQAIGRSRGSRATKICALTDIIDRPYALILTPDSVTIARTHRVDTLLGVSPRSLPAWKRHLAKAVSGDRGNDAEIRHLKHELAQATEGRDILKRPPRISPGMQGKIRVCS